MVALTIILASVVGSFMILMITSMGGEPAASVQISETETGVVKIQLGASIAESVTVYSTSSFDDPTIRTQYTFKNQEILYHFIQ